MANETTEKQDRVPFPFKQIVKQARKDYPGVWKQESARISEQYWQEAGAPLLLYRDRLTGIDFINPVEGWRLSEVINEGYTAFQLTEKEHPALDDILNADKHLTQDWAGRIAKEWLDTIEAEDTGWSMLDQFVPDYEWYEEMAGLSRAKVDSLWKYYSIQLGQSAYQSAVGGNAKGMTVLISNGGMGKSTLVEAIAQNIQSLVFEAKEAKGLVIPEGTSIISTDNMAGSTPDKWALRGMFLNSTCTYFTEKAHYLKNDVTLDLFKGVLAGQELEFRLMHSTKTQRGKQRATVFLDFNPSMVNSLLSGKLADDTATARRFNFFYIKEANKDAWQTDKQHLNGGFLKLSGDEETKKRWWRWVKWCHEQRDVIHGVIALDVQESFNKSIKALAAQSATSTTSRVRGKLLDETKLIVSEKHLEGVGVDMKDLNTGGKAYKDCLIMRNGNEPLSLYLSGKQHKLSRSESVITRDGNNWNQVKSNIADLFEDTALDTNNKASVKEWLDQLVWQEAEDGDWRLVNSTYKRSQRLSVVGQPTNQPVRA